MRNKKSHSMVGNIFYFVLILFKVAPGLVIGDIVFSIVRKLPARIISVLGVKYMVDAVQQGSEPRAVLKIVLIVAVVLLTASCAEALFREFYWNVAREKAYRGLNKTLYEKARALDLECYDNPKFYNNFILTIESSSDNIQNIMGMVQGYVSELISLVTIGSIILTIDPVCLLIILVIVAIFTPISKKIGSVQMQRREDNNRLHRKADYFARVFYLQDYVKEVRMNNIMPLLMKRYNESAQEVCDNQKSYISKIDLMYFIQETGVQIIGFMFLLPLYLGYCVLERHTLSAGDFIASFNGAFSIAYSFSFLTVTAVRNFSERAKMIEKYREFIKTESKIKDGEQVAEITEPKEICLKNVCFTYPGNDEPTLKNINITLHPKEKIALVGYNGAGKTTLTNLLLRLYDVTDGEITIDGTDIRDVTIESHRSRFSAVFQDFQIFSATLGENVALDSSYDDERVSEALRHSGFNKQTEKGNETYLLREFDDDGIMMSGGESQKVAIARAFYKKCPYVILDEPSANLDPVAEYNLNQAMIEVADNKTVIFISHRLSTTVNADIIYVMENGEIIEQGSHEELMAMNGTYAYMFNLQAEKYQI